MTLLTENEIKEMIKEIFPYSTITSSYDTISFRLNTCEVKSLLLKKIKGKYKLVVNHKQEISLIFRIN